MDLSVTLRGQRRDLNLKNPVLTASGTFGSGLEYTPFGNLGDLGGIVVKVDNKQIDTSVRTRLQELAQQLTQFIA